MWLFRAQFKKTAAEERSIRDIAIFSVAVYLKAWITAPIAVNAPLNDFTLMANLLTYPHTTISSATSKKLGIHLWYLSEVLIGLALFDSRVSNDSKKLMIAAMEEAAPDHPPKRPSVKSDAFLGTSGLEQNCTTNSKKLFQVLGLHGLSEIMLSKDPALWEEDEAF